jgi:predicted transcriptional regulator
MAEKELALLDGDKALLEVLRGGPRYLSDIARMMGVSETMVYNRLFRRLLRSGRVVRCLTPKTGRKGRPSYVYLLGVEKNDIVAMPDPLT